MTRPGWLCLPLLLVLAQPAASQIRLGPERSFASNQIARAPEIETQPEVATDGREFLAVWVDGRSFIDRELYASRLDSNGLPLDPLGIRLSEIGDDRWGFDVAFGGSTYIVLDNKLAITEVDRDGRIVSRHSSGITPVDAPGTIKLRAIGNGLMTLYGYGVVRAAALDTHGVTVSEPVTIGPGAAQDLASNGTITVALMTAGAALEMVVLDNAARPIGDRVRLSGSNGLPERNSASITSDGRNFIAVWHDYLGHTIEAQRIDSSGALIGGRVTLVKGQDLIPTTPKITWTGRDYVVTYYAGSTVLAPGRLESIHVDGDLQTVTTPVVEYSHSEVGVRAFAVAPVTATPVAVIALGHPNKPDVETDIFAKRIESGDELKLVTQGWPAGVNSSVAFANGKTVMLWREYRGSTLARRDPAVVINVNGESIDAVRGDSQVALVAGGRDSFLTLWSDLTTTYVQVSGYPARALPPAPPPTYIVYCAVTANGGGYVIARTNSASLQMFTLDETGQVLSMSEVLPISQPGSPSQLSVACNQSVCVAAYVDQVEPTGCPRFSCFKIELRVARFTTKGALIDDAPIVVTRNVNGDGKPAIQRVGEDFLLAFPYTGTIQAVRLDSHGLPIANENEIVIARGSLYAPTYQFSMSALRDTAVVMWEEPRGIVAATINDRSVSAPMLVVSGFARRPSLTAASDRLLLAYDRVVPERGSPVVFLRDVFVTTGRPHAVIH